MTAADNFNDLPIYIGMGQASRHDSVLGLRALCELRDLYPFVFEKFIGDSAHDAYPWYELLHSWKIEAFIDLNTRRQGKLTLPGFTVDNDGTPICAGGFPMVYWGYCEGRRRIKWRCPLVCGKAPECLNKCSPSKYGRVVYTKPEKDLRLFPKTPRNSKAWKKVYARRITSERTNKRQKNDYQLERTRSRSKRRIFWRLTLGAINQHLDAWVAQSQVTLDEIIGIAQAA
ncbi:MAG: transposase [Eubacteriales bacterium]